MSRAYHHTFPKENYEDYSSGRVLYGAPLATNFPVRLSSEILQQCIKYLKDKGSMGPYKIYDPFCGAAYSLTVIGLMHPKEIRTLIGSDSDTNILEFATKNLSLLTREGMVRRINELEGFIREFKKDSHKAALKSAHRLNENLVSVDAECFRFNAISQNDSPELVSEIDIIITDLPYGKLAQWDISESTNNLTQIFLDNIKPNLASVSAVAIVSDKKQVIGHNGFMTVSAFKLGKRKITLLSPNL